VGAGRRGGKAAAWRRATACAPRGAGTTWRAQAEAHAPRPLARCQACPRRADAGRDARRQLGSKTFAGHDQPRCDDRPARPYAGIGACATGSGTGAGDYARGPRLAGRDRPPTARRVRTAPCARGDPGGNRRLDRRRPPCRPHRIDPRCTSATWRRGCPLPYFAAQPSSLKPGFAERPGAGNRIHFRFRIGANTGVGTVAYRRRYRLWELVMFQRVGPDLRHFCHACAVPQRDVCKSMSLPGNEMVTRK